MSGSGARTGEDAEPPTAASGGRNPSAPGSLRRRRRLLAALAALAVSVMLLAAIRPDADIFDEGRYVTSAVVSLGESIVAEFGSDRAAEATLSMGLPVSCALPPPWAPNRVIFSGTLWAVLPASVEVAAVVAHATENAEQLGLTVRERGTATVRLRSARGTDIELVVRPAVESETVFYITYRSRCLPRPRGYRGDRIDNIVRLRNDWPARIGFRSGPLSQARAVGTGAEDTPDMPEG